MQGAALRILVLTEAANINIPIPRFDPMTPKPQSSGRPHTHVWLEEDAELLWCPPCEELQMLQRSEAKPPDAGVVRPQLLTGPEN